MINNSSLIIVGIDNYRHDDQYIQIDVD